MSERKRAQSKPWWKEKERRAGECNKGRARDEESRPLGRKRWRRRCIEKGQAIGDRFIIYFWSDFTLISTWCDIVHVEVERQLLSSVHEVKTHPERPLNLSNPCFLYYIFLQQLSSMATTQVSLFVVD
jgi:hypothetical protein